VPKPDTALIPPNNNRNPVHPYVQLSYVLPRSQLGLLPPQIEQLLVSNHGEFYPLKYGFKWAFCRYFWEAHPILPEITLDFLEEIIDGVIV
jgi:5'-3' exonuclease